VKISDCPVCNNKEFKEVFRDHNRRDGLDCKGAYVRCLECSHIFLWERPEWQEIVKFYSSRNPLHTSNSGLVDAGKSLEHKRYVVPKWKQLLRKVRFRPHSWPLEQVAPNSKRLLDLGCGNGSKLIEFAERGYDVFGVDVSGDSVEACRKILPAGHFVRSELEGIDLPGGYFDYIRIDNTLEHVPDPLEVIRECRRLLKRGGQLIIHVPHGRSLTLRIMKGDSISSWIPFHLQLFTRKSLTHLCSKVGLGKVRIYGYYPVPWLSSSLNQWLNSKNMKVKIRNYYLETLFYPIGWFASKIGLAEEIVAMVRG